MKILKLSYSVFMPSPLPSASRAARSVFAQEHGKSSSVRPRRETGVIAPAHFQRLIKSPHPLPTDKPRLAVASSTRLVPTSMTVAPGFDPISAHHFRACRSPPPGNIRLTSLCQGRSHCPVNGRSFTVALGPHQQQAHGHPDNI